MDSDSSAANIQAEGMAKSPENNNQQVLAMLQKNDLEIIRMLDDLICLLIRKGVIAVTDLPPMAQVKLMNRVNTHQELGGLE